VRGRDSKESAILASKIKLGSATLTVAVLIVFFVLALATLLWLVLAGLARLFPLAGLATLTTLLLALSELAALLALFLHVVCHESFLLGKRGPSHAFVVFIAI